MTVRKSQPSSPAFLPLAFQCCAWSAHTQQSAATQPRNASFRPRRFTLGKPLFSLYCATRLPFNPILLSDHPRLPYGMLEDLRDKPVTHWRHTTNFEKFRQEKISPCQRKVESSYSLQSRKFLFSVFVLSFSFCSALTEGARRATGVSAERRCRPGAAWFVPAAKWPRSVCSAAD